MDIDIGTLIWECIRYFGLAILLLVFLFIFYKLFNNMLTFACGLGSIELRDYGKWAVVTGCTDGIGKAYVEEFAKRGINVVLISRSLDKLTNQSIDLINKYPGLETRIIAVDFTLASESIYSRIESSLRDLKDIGILVNNVGMGHKPQYFHEFARSSDQAVENLIACNVLACTKMTTICLPKMVDRRKGLIINLSSMLGRIPIPYLASYSASKAYVDFFSRSLMREYSQLGIRVQSLCPHYVSTKINNVPPSFFSPTPNEFVKSALKTIRTQAVSSGCFIHNIQCWYGEWIIPEWLVEKISFHVLKYFKNEKNCLTIKSEVIA